MSRLEIDLTCLMEAGAAAIGLPESDLDAIAERAAQAVDRTTRLRDEGQVGFMALADGRDLARRALEYARELPADIENFVVLGIGGSSLGGRALYSALARPYDVLRPRVPGLPRRLFFADNIDPVTFGALLEICPLERTVFNAVSKSGGTAETAAQLLIIAERLKNSLGAEGLRRHLVVTTDPEKGALRRIAGQHGLTAFEVPPSVGGRYSVLSAVGLVPAAAAGLDVHGLLDGAAAMRARVAGERDLRKNPALLLAAALHLHDRRGRRIHIMMPYADQLYDTAEWFRQLWAESLGKALDLQGKTVHVGPTPVAARGATDQHSQLQLFAEGPDDKVIVFVDVKERGADVAIPKGPFSDDPDFGYLAGHGLAELIDAERRGVQVAMTRAGRPNATIRLDRLDAAALGELMMLLEAATAFAGPLYDIDPYDQPGVEEGKRFAFGLLGRKGFEAKGEEARSGQRRDPRFVL